jgi:hypothetical protein
MRHSSWSTGTFLFFAPLLACDARVGNDYQGESLLTLRGSVVLDENVPGALVPALAFRGPMREFHLLDVEVHGQFPAQFRVDVLDPPPDDAMYSGSDNFADAKPDEPHFAYAFVAAVAPDHPARVEPVFASSGGIRCGDSADAPCERRFETCTEDRSECHERVQQCDAQLDNCRLVSSSGSADFLAEVMKQFAGFSDEYLVLYLDGPTPEGSAISRAFARRKPLAAGYHLIRIKFTGIAFEVTAEDRMCRESAEELALRRYNDSHGTMYTSIQDVPQTVVDGGMAPPGAPAVPHVAQHDIDIEFGRAFAELGCRTSPFELTKVEDAQQPLSLEIGHIAPPFIGI